MNAESCITRAFPTTAGVMFGLGLGGFFDGIVLHQLLQWHHMLSTWYPISTLENLKLNTLWDGIFHSTTYVFVLIGFFILWRAAHRRHLRWSNQMLLASVLLGWGLFNLVEGVIDHQILGMHHVNETVGPDHRWLWDAGFLLWGFLMIVAGWWLLRKPPTRRLTRDP
jgi:uncharacterized membrane protein